MYNYNVNCESFIVVYADVLGVLACVCILYVDNKNK